MSIIQSIIDRTGTDDLIALTLVLVSAYLYMTGGDIPDSLSILTTMIVGFFFGKKYTEQTQAKTFAAINPAPAPPYIAGPQD